MEFKTEAQERAYERVSGMMTELFGEFAQRREDRPMFAVRVGSAMAQVGVWPFGENQAAITTRAYVVMDVELTPELMRFLLLKNNQILFGAFGVDEDDDIFIDHSLIGETVDKEELRASIMGVVTVADDMDDQIVSRFGGRRATDPE